MYRIFCESYSNYIKLFDEERDGMQYRFQIVKPMELIIDFEKFFSERQKNSELYKKTADLIFYMEQNLEKYPIFKAFLWMLESRGIMGKFYGSVLLEDLNEQAKLAKMFLSLMYWEEAV